MWNNSHHIEIWKALFKEAKAFSWKEIFFYEKFLSVRSHSRTHVNVVCYQLLRATTVYDHRVRKCRDFTPPHTMPSFPSLKSVFAIGKFYLFALFSLPIRLSIFFPFFQKSWSACLFASCVLKGEVKSLLSCRDSFTLNILIFSLECKWKKYFNSPSLPRVRAYTLKPSWKLNALRILWNKFIHSWIFLLMKRRNKIFPLPILHSHRLITSMSSRYWGKGKYISRCKLVLEQVREMKKKEIYCHYMLHVWIENFSSSFSERKEENQLVHKRRFKCSHSSHICCSLLSSIESLLSAYIYLIGSNNKH